MCKHVALWRQLGLWLPPLALPSCAGTRSMLLPRITPSCERWSCRWGLEVRCPQLSTCLRIDTPRLCAFCSLQMEIDYKAECLGGDLVESLASRCGEARLLADCHSTGALRCDSSSQPLLLSVARFEQLGVFDSSKRHIYYLVSPLAASPSCSPGSHAFNLPTPPRTRRHTRCAGVQRRWSRRIVLCARAAPLPGREGS